MKQHSPHNTDPHHLAEPDAFEQQWLSRLTEPDPELARSADQFVAGVLDRHAQARRPLPAIAGRIGMTSPLPYAAAAVLLIGAALMGFYLFKGGSVDTPTNPVARDDSATPGPDQPQPDGGSAVAHRDPSGLRLGSLIAQTRTTVTRPAANLTATLRQSTPTIGIKDLLELIDSPVPDMKELLAPLAPSNQQSRA